MIYSKKYKKFEVIVMKKQFAKYIINILILLGIFAIILVILRLLNVV
jgi:hypothetical protein